MSPGHMLMTNKQVFDSLASNMARYSLAPTRMNLTKLMAGAVVGSFKREDFSPRYDPKRTPYAHRFGDLRVP